VRNSETQPTKAANDTLQTTDTYVRPPPAPQIEKKGGLWRRTGNPVHNIPPQGTLGASGARKRSLSATSGPMGAGNRRLDGPAKWRALQQIGTRPSYELRGHSFRLKDGCDVTSNIRGTRIKTTMSPLNAATVVGRPCPSALHTRVRCVSGPLVKYATGGRGVPTGMKGWRHPNTRPLGEMEPRTNVGRGQMNRATRGEGLTCRLMHQYAFPRTMSALGAERCVITTPLKESRTILSKRVARDTRH